VQAERAAYRAWQATLSEQARCSEGTGRVFCVDESGIAIGERVRYGYAKRGQPCVETAPYRAGRRSNLIGFVCSDGTGAVTTIEGTPVCRKLFSHVMTDQLVPRLRQGDVVLWDNHTIHKHALLTAQIEAAGAKLVWLPRYSPDLNPAEYLWSHVKRRVRRVGADSAEALREALTQAVASVEPPHIAAWLRHGGFPSQPHPV
jgi:putative transposase